MRILYNIKYEDIDSRISDSQMGARKEKGCRNKLFIINGIVFDILKNRRSKPAVLQIVDFSQIVNF